MRFVVVEIPDNAEADAFVAAIENDNIIFGTVTGQVEVDGRMVDELHYNSPASEWKVPQVYAVPTMFCECPTKFSQARSKKYGWFVCVNCSKPRKGVMQHPFNLKELPENVKTQVYYMGFRADRQGWRIPNKMP